MRLTAAWALVALLSLALPRAVFAGCEADTPARPVPQFDEELAPGVSLWPLHPTTGEVRLQPAGLPQGITRSQLPVLPSNQDSTDYQTLTMPGEWSGHELFRDLASPGSRFQYAPPSRWLAVAYNAGIEVWDLAPNPAHPALLDQKDGWTAPFGPGEWAIFPPASEMDTFLQAVEVFEDGDRLVIAIASLRPAGFAVWVFDTLGGTLEQVYQDPWNVDSYDISLVADPNGKTYAFVTSTGTAGNDGGVYVYDLSTVADMPLCIDLEDSHTCGVFVGEMADLPKARHVSTLVVDGETYVAASDGKQLGSPLDLEIWRVADPGDPGASPAGSSTLVFSGLGDRVSAPQLFTYDGGHYVALVEDVGASPDPDQMRIHRIDHCLDADGCVSLGPALAVETIKNSLPFEHFLDVTFSGGRPFLHYGMQTTGLFGDGFERLWELGSLPSAFPIDTLPELTDGGGTYVDPCNGRPVGYFGDYYVGNDNGLRRFNPRHAIFVGDYLYRASLGLFDVHRRRDVGRIFADDFESGDCQNWSSGCPAPDAFR